MKTPKNRRKHDTSKCEICGKSVVASLKRHILEVHGNKGVKPFKCSFPDCTFSALRKSNLEIHENRHTKKKDYRYVY